MTHTQNQTTTRPEAPTRSTIRAADTIRERHYQPMQIHLSATQPAKSNLSTHLGITIRWGAAPSCYLSVAIGGAGAALAVGRGGDALC